MQSYAPVEAPETNCDVCRMPMSAHGPAMEHPPAFDAGREYERERCAKILEAYISGDEIAGGLPAILVKISSGE